MSDLAIDCIKKDLETAYQLAIQEASAAIAAMKSIKRVLQQASEGKEITGHASCYRQHVGVMDLCRNQIYALERLLEEIEFERSVEHDSSGVMTPLKLWKSNRDKL